MDSESNNVSSRRGVAVFLLFLTCFTMFLLIGRSLAAEAEPAPLAPASTRVQQGESVQIVYIVDRSNADNAAVEKFLTANGFAVDLLPLGGSGYSLYLPLIKGLSTAPGSGAAADATTQIVSELPDLAAYDLVLIGADTGSGATWMAGLPDLANGLVNSGLPIMGLGAGGHAFFGKLGLEIGHPNGTAVSAAKVTVADWGDSHDLYATPNGIDVPQNRVLALFDSQRPGIALTLEKPPLAGMRITAVDNGGYPIAAEDDNKLLWSFDAPTSALTANGEALLLNSLWYLVRELTVSLPSGDITPSRGIEAELLDALATTNAPEMHALLQLNSLPTPAEEAVLQTAGVTLLGYLGGTTYKAAVSTAFEANDPPVTALVRWGGLLQPVDKMPPKLAAGQFEAWAINGDGTINVIATMHSDMSTAEMRTLLDDYDDGAEQDGSLTFRMQLLPAQISALANEDEVVWIEEGPEPVELNNDRGRLEMYVDEAQDLDLSGGLINYRGVSGQDINVGIFDTGVTSDTFSHPDFAGRLLREKFDSNSHGTHVAGIVGGSGADSNNLRLRGMAPQAGLIPYNLNPFWNATRMQEALITYEMDVSNHSYTHGCGGYGTAAQNADELVRGDLVYRGGSSPVTLPSHLYVSAAGNQGSSAQYCRTAALPGSSTFNDPTSGLRGYYAITNPSKNAVVVGALEPNSNLRLQASSSRGPTWDGRIKPDIVADGTLVSTRNVPSSGGSTYVSKSGTSMASPVVAGIAALIYEQYETSFPAAERPQPALIKAMLAQTAIDLVNAPEAAGFQAYSWNDPDSAQDLIYHPGPDWATGYGAVNAARAVDTVAAGAFRNGIVSPDNMTVEYPIYVTNGRSELKFTLAWDDEAGDKTTATRLNTAELINDLDLELQAPDGTIYYPWLLNLPPRHNNYVTGNAWRETGAQDPIDHATDITPAFQGVNRRDNMEQVQVTDANGLPSGQWIVRVKAFQLPNNNEQRFAIAGDFSMTLKTHPTLRVWTPMPGQTFAQTDNIDLMATAEDMDEADEKLTIQWWSENQYGVPTLLGSSTSGEILTISASALPGCGGDNIPLIVRAIDSDGSQHELSQVIKANLNSPAVISIESPTSGDSFVDSQVVSLRGSGSDPRCAASFDAAQLKWRQGSSSGSLLGSGPEVATTLPAGNHTIFLVYNDEGLEIIDSVAIAITATPTETVQITVLYYAENSGNTAPTGEVTDAGYVSRADWMVVGDDAADAAHRGFVTFDLAPLPDDLNRIVSAGLSINIIDEVNSPYNDLIELYAYHVDFGPTLEEGDFTPTYYLPIRHEIANVPGNTGFQTITVTQSVQDAWTNRVTYSERLQFAFQFKNAKDVDGTAEYVRIRNEETYNNNHPGIEITYEIEEPLNPPSTKILTPAEGTIIFDYSNPPNAAVEFTGYGNGPAGFFADSDLTWEYRLVAEESSWVTAGSGEEITISLADISCDVPTPYQIRLTADNGILPPGYDIVHIGVQTLIC